MKVEIKITCKYCMGKAAFMHDELPKAMTYEAEQFFVKHYHNGAINPHNNFLIEKKEINMENNNILPYVFITDGNVKIFLDRGYKEIAFSSGVMLENYIKEIYTQHRKKIYDNNVMDWYWIYNDETMEHQKQCLMNEFQKIMMTDLFSPCPPSAKITGPGDSPGEAK